MYFGPSEKALVRKAFAQAEKAAAQHFHLLPETWKIYRYDVKTLESLEKHEVREGAFAHLCKYCYHRSDGRGEQQAFHFYRVCLQDNRILDAVARSSLFIKLDPLMLYIATHELVHILRFNRGESDFDMPHEEKQGEEDRVHLITENILKPIANPGVNLVLECFSNDYRIRDLFN